MTCAKALMKNLKEIALGSNIVMLVSRVEGECDSPLQ